jgi:hypothetical protein
VEVPEELEAVKENDVRHLILLAMHEDLSDTVCQVELSTDYVKMLVKRMNVFLSEMQKDDSLLESHYYDLHPVFRDSSLVDEEAYNRLLDGDFRREIRDSELYPYDHGDNASVEFQKVVIDQYGFYYVLREKHTDSLYQTLSAPWRVLVGNQEAPLSDADHLEFLKKLSRDILGPMANLGAQS